MKRFFFYIGEVTKTEREKVTKTTTPMVPLYLWAGGPSMMMLIHRICMALSGLGKFISVATEISVRAAMLLETSRGQG